MARPEKTAAVAELVEDFKSAQATFLTEYRGLTVTSLKELRRSLGSETKYSVVKNTLTKIAAKDAGVDIDDALLAGPSALAFIKGDDLCPDIMTKPFGASTSAKGQQMEGFFKHRREVLGHKYFRPQSTGSGTFKLVQADPSTLKS